MGKLIHVGRGLQLVGRQPDQKLQNLLKHAVLHKPVHKVEGGRPLANDNISRNQVKAFIRMKLTADNLPILCLSAGKLHKGTILS